MLLSVASVDQVTAMSKTGADQLKLDEGFTPRATRLKLQDGSTEKVRTIGYGYNINAAADPIADFMALGLDQAAAQQVLDGKADITKEQGEALFRISLQRATEDAQRVIPRFEELEPDMQDVFVNMAYQLGGKGLRGFKSMRSNLVKGDYRGVAKEILNSRFARDQATSRAQRLAKKVLSVDKQRQKQQPARAEAPSPEKYYKAEIHNDRVSRLVRALVYRDQVNRLATALTTMSARKEEDPEENQ